MRQFLLTGLATTLSLPFVGACERQPAAPPATSAPVSEATPVAPAKTTSSLEARTKQTDGTFAKVGVFHFLPDGKVELTVTGTGPDADRLRAAWKEVEARPTLQTKQEDAQGNLAGHPVARGAAEYPAALADVMSREFGFFLSPSKD